ncbi:hypothetical protein IH992_15560 [Candidatus Poribacteria bacterium]|nr:hypothetical protein [Candidatus Poribacteria bacterium]
MTRFQRPYSLDAPKSATMVEIVDAPMIEIPVPKPMPVNHGGASNSREAGDGNLSAGNALGIAKDSRNEAQSKQNGWTQTDGPYGGSVTALHATPDGTLFAGTTGMGIFRSTDGSDSWHPASQGLQKIYGMLPGINTFAQKGNTLYAGTIGDLFSSSDGGNSWQQLTRFPFPGGISGITTIGERLYIGVRRDESVYFSDDDGKSWTRMDNELTNREMLLGLVASGTTLFAKTEENVFYRRAGENWWTELSPGSKIYTLAVSGTTVYAATKDNRLLRSTDEGKTWVSTELPQMLKDMRLHVAAGKVYAYSYSQYPAKIFRSDDDGETWNSIHPQVDTGITSAMTVSSRNQLYAATGHGILRSTDGGDSWEFANRGLISTHVGHLTVFKNTLYATTGCDIFKLTDSDLSWKPIRRGWDSTGSVTNFAISGDVLYVAVHETINRHQMENGFPLTSGIFRLSDDGAAWVPVDREIKSDTDKNNGRHLVDRFAVSADTFYALMQVDSGHQLFRWKKGETLWTGPKFEWKLGWTWMLLAVSGKTVYVGPPHGEILRSFDEGESWTNISQNLPNWEETPAYPSHHGVSDLTFVGTTIYANTNNGVIRSTDDGDTWTTVNAGLDEGNVGGFITDGTMLYGRNPGGIFRLKDGEDNWERVASLPYDMAESLAVHRGMLYVGTGNAGVFRISLEK